MEASWLPTNQIEAPFPKCPCLQTRHWMVAISYQARRKRGPQSVSTRSSGRRPASRAVPSRRGRSGPCGGLRLNAYVLRGDAPHTPCRFRGVSFDYG
jgi:hypothetical protein